MVTFIQKEWGLKLILTNELGDPIETIPVHLLLVDMTMI
jgi:hypothetical protein